MTTTRPPDGAPWRVGIDLGGTKTEAVLLSPEGDAVFRRRVPTPRSESYGAILDVVASIYADAAAAVPAHARHVVGMGIPGMVDADTGQVMNANTTCLIGHPLQADLESRLNRPVVVDNDANCFVLAEALSGAGQGFGLVFGVIMGTGCGGGICVDGRLHRGRHLIAGEWGHFSVDPAGRACWCGNRGCVETLISGSGVEAAFAQATGRRLPMSDIVTLARTGESEPRRVFDALLDDFGRCLGGLISLLDPDAVILGGGLSHIDELYTRGMEAVRRYAFHRHVMTPVLKNRLGDSAGVIGAAWLGREG